MTTSTDRTNSCMTARAAAAPPRDCHSDGRKFEVERDDGARLMSRLDGFTHDEGRGRTEPGKDAAGMQPARTYRLEDAGPVDVSGASCDAAELARSEAPTAPRTPKPRSVKLRPLRTDRPMPSYGTQWMWPVSTPPWRMRSSGADRWGCPRTRWPGSCAAGSSDADPVPRCTRRHPPRRGTCARCGCAPRPGRDGA